MSEARSRQLWDVGSNVMCLIAKAWLKPPTGHAFAASDFNPWEFKVRKPIKLDAKASMKVLKAVFCR